MKFINWLLWASFIKNTDMPSCVNCVHFIEPIAELKWNDKSELVSVRVGQLGKCKLFGDKNLVTGKIDYKSALDCRHDSPENKLCGIDGKYFEEAL